MNDSISMRIQYFLYVRTPVGPWYTRKQLRRAKLAFPEGHTILKTFDFRKFKITAIPICFDNYCYAIINLARNTCILVDVGDSEPVLEFLEREDILPNAILSTHKHW
uniref:Metallo-beta-lactamase domain-containing protein n=1 Tax=Acrobeloides nanus TaxID=290746 RepID=A0A914CW55_9BILA